MTAQSNKASFVLLVTRKSLILAL